MTRNGMRVAIVTGGSRGIGAACVRRLVSENWAAVIAYGANVTAANKVITEVRDGGGDAVAIQADVADEVAMSTVFRAAEEHFGGLHAVVHAAGVMPLASIVDLALNELDDVYRTNIRGAFVVNQLAARHVREGGAIVNLSSSVVGATFATYGAYAASKGAVEVLTRVLAKELGTRNISVNAVAPGPTATDLFLRGKSAEQIGRLTGSIPLGRLGKPEDISDLVAFLVSSSGHWVNGQVIRANGGMI